AGYAGCYARPADPVKPTVRQALMARSLRAADRQRNAAGKLCTAKQLLRAGRRWTRGTKVLSTKRCPFGSGIRTELQRILLRMPEPKGHQKLMILVRLRDLTFAYRTR